MKVAILAGGQGTRLAEETAVRPKPMVAIGEHPILWHIMKHYAHYGFNDFIIALGYKGDIIKSYMRDLCMLNANLELDMSTGKMHPKGSAKLSWKVDLVDTGLLTNTGGRIKRLKEYVGNQTFMLTWGDGLSNVNLNDLLTFHKNHGKLATLTAVHPPSRFGCLELMKDGSVKTFEEKPQKDDGWVNGAFFILEPGVFDYIDHDDTQWEKEPLEKLAQEGQLMAYKHDSFWQCMDTIKEKRILEEFWKTGNAPWKVWND